jgi:phosphoenolpyruvate carboxykinase (ATP)
VAGTEAGVTERSATFSTCFGSPFMPLGPAVYGDLVRNKVARHKVTCWLVNTGWSRGSYGVGSRRKIAYSRALVDSALNGTLNAGVFEKDAFFGLDIPTSCDGVPGDVLNPRNTWADKKMYDEAATRLVEMFKDNFEKYAPNVTAGVANVM